MGITSDKSTVVMVRYKISSPAASGAAECVYIQCSVVSRVNDVGGGPCCRLGDLDTIT